MIRRSKLERLYYKYRDIMFAEAYKVLKEKNLAEDAVSEAFIRIMKNLQKIDDENSTKTRNFLAVICRNVAVDIYRKRVRDEHFFNSIDEEYISYNTPENLVLSQESMNQLVDIITHMDSIYKDTLIMSRIYKLERNDIAQIFGISPEAVTKRIQRAKAEIINQLKKEEE